MKILKSYRFQYLVINKINIFSFRWFVLTVKNNYKKLKQKKKKNF